MTKQLSSEKNIKSPASMKSRQLGTQAKINRIGYLFVLPFVLVFALFQLWPTLYTIILSFGNLRGLTTEFDIIGFGNFIKLITDKFFWGAVGNTFILWGINFVPQLGIALLLAIWFTDVRLDLKCKGIFRAIFYMPNLLTAASVAILYRSLFGYPNGPINWCLGQLGIYAHVVKSDGSVIEEAFQFFRSPAMSRCIVSFIQWWLWCGNTLILLMAGITSISPTLYESAVIDGANSRQSTWYITLPLLRPIMLYLLITSMIGGMNMFDIPFLLTDMRGGPDYKIRTTAVYLYNIAFQGRNDSSYAAAIAIGMFIITMILAALINYAVKDHSEAKYLRRQKQMQKEMQK